MSYGKQAILFWFVTHSFSVQKLWILSVCLHARENCIPDVHVIFWMTNLLEIQLFLLWLSLWWASANKINLYLSLIETIESYLQSSFQLYTRYDLMHQQISKIFLWTISLVSMLVFTVSPFSESCKDCMDCLLSNCAKTVEIIVVRVWKGSFLRYNQCFTYLLTHRSD